MINQEKIQSAIALLLEGLGEDVAREGLVDTPNRVARMYQELLAGREVDPSILLSKTFSVTQAGLVMEKEIPFYSICEHHLMPFFGQVHVAYLPKDRVVGISKLIRCVECYAKQLQIQERMTEEIAEAIMVHLQPHGVMVMVEAEHLCVSMRGVKKPGSTTVTLSTKGVFAQESELREQFMRMLNR
ncbi:MAG: GTP cyclohydrolase I FolE [Lachnospiraceae bacterium]|jgi:GTP cyclohydrolase I|nr:GTP cyclohydrolase I FolE [Lachnospiraceae bacterium]